ncbi:hypothetical protein G9A89_004595 [Geosiphon pyriformis]|nr:hypothetical protein G9A89_004595 [Geosiphon pyriformis]
MSSPASNSKEIPLTINKDQTFFSLSLKCSFVSKPHYLEIPILTDNEIFAKHQSDQISNYHFIFQLCLFDAFNQYPWTCENKNCPLYNSGGKGIPKLAKGILDYESENSPSKQYLRNIYKRVKNLRDESRGKFIWVEEKIKQKLLPRETNCIEYSRAEIPPNNSDSRSLSIPLSAYDVGREGQQNNDKPFLTSPEICLNQGQSLPQISDKQVMIYTEYQLSDSRVKELYCAYIEESSFNLEDKTVFDDLFKDESKLDSFPESCRPGFMLPQVVKDYDETFSLKNLDLKDDM